MTSSSAPTWSRLFDGRAVSGDRRCIDGRQVMAMYLPGGRPRSIARRARDPTTAERPTIRLVVTGVACGRDLRNQDASGDLRGAAPPRRAAQLRRAHRSQRSHLAVAQRHADRDACFAPRDRADRTSRAAYCRYARAETSIADWSCTACWPRAPRRRDRCSPSIAPALACTHLDQHCAMSTGKR